MTGFPRFILEGRGAVVYDDCMTRLLKLVAWVLLAAIAFATLSPVDLRPHLTSPDLERFGTFAALGLVFGFAYSKMSRWVAPLIVVGSAVGLEMLQLIDPTRDGRISDALFKAAGGLLGCAVGYGARRLIDRRRTA